MEKIQISNRIKQERKKLKMTQSKLACLAGVSIPTISRIEKGKVGDSNLEAACKALGLALVYNVKKEQNNGNL